MSSIKVGKPNHASLFDASRIIGDKVREQEEFIFRLKLRRARGVIVDDPIGFDSSTDARFLKAPSS